MSVFVAVDGSAPTSIGDVDHDGRPDLTVKFSRMAVEQSVPDGDPAPVTIGGAIGNDCFEETAWTRVIQVPVTAPIAGSVSRMGDVAEVRWNTPTGIPIQSVALLVSVDWSCPDSVDG